MSIVSYMYIEGHRDSDAMIEMVSKAAGASGFADAFVRSPLAAVYASKTIADCIIVVATAGRARSSFQVRADILVNCKGAARKLVLDAFEFASTTVLEGLLDAARHAKRAGTFAFMLFVDLLDEMESQCGDGGVAASARVVSRVRRIIDREGDNMSTAELEEARRRLGAGPPWTM